MALNLLWVLGLFGVGLFFGLPSLLPGIFLGVLIPVLTSGIAIYVLRARIKEIKSEQEDDLSKY